MTASQIKRLTWLSCDKNMTYNWAWWCRLSHRYIGKSTNNRRGSTGVLQDTSLFSLNDNRLWLWKSLAVRNHLCTSLPSSTKLFRIEARTLRKRPIDRSRLRSQVFKRVQLSLRSTIDSLPLAVVNIAKSAHLLPLLNNRRNYWIHSYIYRWFSLFNRIHWNHRHRQVSLFLE